MRDPWNDVELERRFREQARTALPRAPLNSALCRVIATDRSLSSLLGHAPVEQQLPVLLLAAIHFLLLDEADHPLSEWYPNLTSAHRSPDDPELATTLREFVEHRSAAILHVLESRRVQTNEVGRCALFVPSFAALTRDGFGSLAHVDVGTSAGLNTLLPRFAYRYDDAEIVGDSNVVIECSTRGAGPTVTSTPPVAFAIGIDSRPIDVSDRAEARWLEACCWPDQADRFERLRAAIAIARSHPPTIVDGDAVDVLESTIHTAAEHGHPVVTTSWVLNYFDAPSRRAFVDEIDRLGHDADLTWLLAESPAQTPELPHAADLVGEHVTALTAVSWRGGKRSVHHLATCHPHGYWIHWR